ncbi:DUF4360 domain-containing protein [Actinoplanes hulinensis]|uniref:DUF4360 domain-containing protein n=1 Tax=Actinoplanes hulinensis TaxID=1144547 RepID=A0ABS7AUK7_9ACTN|nr:DUF4360 domain-containing protein [Actinoplanes hulinensis]MBW6432387.1 DUF4360 domain-containing protein [Actinoplanes hulinensis]
MFGLKIIVMALVGTSLLVPAASASPLPPRTQPQLTVKLLNANGSGCRRSATTKPPVDALVLPSGAVTVRYRGFSVSGNDYKSCVLFVSVAAPAGWTYLIPSVANQATVTLDGAATATLSTAMWFTGIEWTVIGTRKVAGPRTGTWNTSVVPHQAAWAPCGTSVNLSIAETMRVAGGSASTAGLVATTFGSPKWRRC